MKIIYSVQVSHPIIIRVDDKTLKRINHLKTYTDTLSIEENEDIEYNIRLTTKEYRPQWSDNEKIPIDSICAITVRRTPKYFTISIWVGGEEGQDDLLHWEEDLMKIPNIYFAKGLLGQLIERDIVGKDWERYNIEGYEQMLSEMPENHKEFLEKQKKKFIKDPENKYSMAHYNSMKVRKEKAKKEK